MSYSQALKFMKTRRGGRQPIVLGRFSLPKCNHPIPVPHYKDDKSKEPDYWMCLRCGAKDVGKDGENDQN